MLELKPESIFSQACYEKQIVYILCSFCFDQVDTQTDLHTDMATYLHGIIAWREHYYLEVEILFCTMFMLLIVLLVLSNCDKWLRKSFIETFLVITQKMSSCLMLS